MIPVSLQGASHVSTIGRAVADRKTLPFTQVIAVRVGALGYWPVLVMYAVRTGFAGALSTVSTFVAEVSCVPVAATKPSYSVCLLVSGWAG